MGNHRASMRTLLGASVAIVLAASAVLPASAASASEIVPTPDSTAEVVPSPAATAEAVPTPTATAEVDSSQPDAAPDAVPTPDSTTASQSSETPAVADPSVSAVPDPGDLHPSYEASETKSFVPGFIVSDANFFAGTALSASQVQRLLNDKGSNCSGPTSDAECLKDFSAPTPSKAADPMCSAYQGSTRESAATIFAKVGVACGINPLALVVLVQKETSLVTTSAPTAKMYRQATGFNCPDTAAGCDAGSSGFFTQVYGAARQFKKYANPVGSDQTFTAYAPGTTPNILFYPRESNPSCGSAPVSVRNQATANLYYYTPYQPNKYALTETGSGAAGPGCATYGNINFWYIFSDWNPAGTLANAGIAPVGSVDRPRISGASLVAGGWAVDPTSQEEALATSIAVTDPSGTTTKYSVSAKGARSDIPTTYPVAGNAHGFSKTVPVSKIGTYKVCVSAASTSWNLWDTSSGTKKAGPVSIGCSSVTYSGAISVSRIEGTDRQATAVAISKATFSPGVPVVYVATGSNFPDALSAAPAAAKRGGPVLLVDTNSMSPAVGAELARLKPQKIIVVGSEASVGAAVYTAIRKYSPSIERLGGSSRYETSRMIIRDAWPSGSSKAWFATGEKFPDALGASAAAGANDAPVLLMNGAAPTADAATVNLATELGVTTLTIAGSPLSVSEGIRAALAKSIPTVSRIAGPDRYSTAQQLNEAAFTKADTVYFATGEKFPDALAGAAAAGFTSSPLYTVHPDCVPQAVLDDLVSLGTKKVVLLGSEQSLSAGVRSLTSCG